MGESLKFSSWCAPEASTRQGRVADRRVHEAQLGSQTTMLPRFVFACWSRPRQVLKVAYLPARRFVFNCTDRLRYYGLSNGTEPITLRMVWAISGAGRLQVRARYWCVSHTTIDPSPTADATRFMAPARRSPAAKIPGSLVSSGNGSRGSFQIRGYASAAIRSRPVTTNPLASRSTLGGSQPLRGHVPINTNSAS